MGSSKKSKKDGEHKKKKKHRSSRSRSRTPKEKKTKREKYAGSRSRSRSPQEKKSKREKPSYSRSKSRSPVVERKEKSRKREREYSPTPVSRDEAEPPRKKSPLLEKSSDSLSIEQTNALRAKLGLKPLKVDSQPDPDKESLKDAIHKPAVNLSDVKRTESIRERMAAVKERRKAESKLGKVKGLANSDSDDDVSNWVKKMSRKDREKKKAEERLKLLDQMDEEFGISSIVEKEFKKDVPAYTSRDLRGLKVSHDQERFKEGSTTILTLADRGVLDEDTDELVNVNLQDVERVEKNLENKKARPGYKAYDDDEVNEFGMMKPKDILSKYDEEISGPKKGESFELGSKGRYDSAHEKKMRQIRAELSDASQSLLSAAPTLQSEFMTREEMDAKFKKRKKKVRKVRKYEMVKADDLLPLDDDDTDKRVQDVGDAAFSSDIMSRVAAQSMEVDKPESDEDLSNIKLDDDADDDYQLNLNIQRRKRLQNRLRPELAAERLLEVVGREEPIEEIDEGKDLPEEESEGLQLTATDEFCRNLGSVATYGVAGNRMGNTDELIDFEQELVASHKMEEAEDEDDKGGWERVDESKLHTERPDIESSETASYQLADEEVLLDGGLVSALRMASNKGFINKEIKKVEGITTSNPSSLLSKNYSIEDKRHDDIDDKFKNRGRDRYSGPTQNFSEKTYVPDFKLEYKDDHGRKLSAKEAFRVLSHKFHGKGSGKKKTEKRMKKIDEEKMMLTMNSTDTPLNTVQRLKEKQEREKTAYIVLSGGSKTMTGSGVVK